MKKDIVPFGLRIPTDIKEQLDQSVAKSQRSLNAEILARLIESFAADQKKLADFTTGELVQELIRRNDPGRIEISIGGFGQEIAR
ncbi:Arc family DNA-binding protein [Noviherbaspirillum autotrophicum]|uniref:Arc-like DNA binding domain-containing protein n=1 Tax=Noviherbaspirillum autotrophicum TaxID=709839 RepID=A0A0C1YTQ3_9BURK|nr:Arc family DNA-binding protein [Noviherbaspirillum autotrophicum]KIF80827.1 hypothetical protein TSA66_08335 [Noviherbaspirillum autotrophicum]KIF84052.1 hypothetical protein TSA66_01025 [Noviherbaspirillum autotrophicum]